MNLRELEYIVAVAEHKHFSRAAEECFVSQPTLSSQIKKLETELGVTLFERTNKQVMLTSVGERIVEAARRTLVEANTIKETAAAARDPFSGTYRLGAFPTLASYLFPEIIPSFKKIFPDIRVVLIEEKTEVLMEQIHNGKIDAAFLAMPVEGEGLLTEHIFDDKLFVAVSDSHPLAREESIDAKLLARENLMLLDEGHCLRNQSLEICDFMGISADADVRATSLETLRIMVEANTGVTIMPEIAIDRSKSGLSYIPFAGKEVVRSIGLARRQTCARSAVFDQFVSRFSRT